jgi:hypothetical protein
MNTLSTFQPGMRVVLAEDYQFFDQGDAGVINAVDQDCPNGEAWIGFDGGAIAFIPLAVLAPEVREFAYRTRSKGISRKMYPTEEAAAEAAEARGFLVFDVIEVKHLAAYKVEHVPPVLPSMREACATA